MEAEEALFILRNIGITSGREGQAIGTAVKVLEKQIPKKPVQHKETTYSKCPICGSFDIDDYCTKCGQRIDWSGEE